MARTHFRIHYHNDVTWCQRTISYGRITPMTNVVTLPERHKELTAIRWNEDGGIDYTPRTPEEREEVRTLWNETLAQVTCLHCRRKFRPM